MTGDMRRALDERRELIEARADAVLDTARQAGEPWTEPLGEPPRDPRKEAAWRRHARTVAAYLDRYVITDDSPLGPEPENVAQKIDAARARSALARVKKPPAGPRPSPSVARASELLPGGACDLSPRECRCGGVE
ncbi:hypothetical protein [Rhodococcus sp. I2R]|uniref:hypothetical protein n=1 Tax=Rhodococcus sp. I2R TaxID=2855445 RepID=UPI001E5DEFCC|nr:hypothetical protein [Rhodococcus sp. I2R]MCC8927326.1 hypothetical protein [Rhodococcus sp. I2R]